MPEPGKVMILAVASKADFVLNAQVWYRELHAAIRERFALENSPLIVRGS